MHFEKISYEMWAHTVCENEYIQQHYNITDEFLTSTYAAIQLPVRATANSAGYDFRSPFPSIIVGDTPINVPTGIRWVPGPADMDKVLLLCPRSGYGFKYGMRLRNTIGVIDADYQMATNEGHIMVKIAAEQSFAITKGMAFVQGIIMQYYTVRDDDAIDVRVGGFGSTSE